MLTARGTVSVSPHLFKLFYICLESFMVHPDIGATDRFSFFAEILIFCGLGLHLGSNYTNRPELTLIHCRVCFSDLFTRTYNTLRVFRFDIFHPASSCYQSIPSQTSLSPFLATKEDKRRHLTDCKLLPHPLNCMSKLRFMT